MKALTHITTVMLVAMLTTATMAQVASSPARPQPTDICSQVIADTVNAAFAGAPYNVTLRSVTFVDTFTSANRAALIDMAVQQGSIPIWDDTDPTVLAVGIIADDPNITQQQIDDYTNFLNGLAPDGAGLYQLTYDSTTAGPFQTFAICKEGALAYENMLFMLPSNGAAPGQQGASPQSVGQATDTSSSSIKNGFGVTVVTFSCTAIADCEDGQLVGCSSTHTASGCFLWHAEGTDSATQVGGNCCRAKCNFGWASGFKSVEVGADGVSIKISGHLGSSGTFSDTAKACCDGVAVR